MKKKIIDKNIIFLLVSAVVIVVCHIVTNIFTISDKPIPIFTTLIIIVGSGIGSGAYLKLKNDKLEKYVKGLVVCSLVAFCMETFLFNFNSFTVGNRKYDFSQYTLSANNYDNISVDEDIVVYGDCELYIELESEDINALKVNFEGGSDSRIKMYTSIRDDNFSRQFKRVGEKIVSANFGRCDFSFNKYGTFHSVLIGFSDVSEPFTISALYFYKAVPFTFSKIRFYGLFLILGMIYSIFSFKLYNVIYDRKKKSHRIVILTSTVIFSASMFCFFDKNTGDTEYRKGMDVSWRDPYVQMFDAIEKGQAHIAIEPSEALLAMEDPYDISVRSEEKIQYAWDRAYYNGKYYSYYGIAPVLTFYYPYYFVVNKLPTINKACIFFGILSVIFMVGTIMAFVRKFIKKPNFMVLMACIAASVFASGIYFNVDFSDMYALPGITGTCYMMLCLWCGLEACLRDGEKKQPILFAVCGIAFSLCLASKPTRALSCLIIAPIFIEYLLTRAICKKKKVLSVLSFMLPVIIGCGSIMIYNNARFDSPFDFGAVYQLTVSNVSAGGLKISSIPNAILHYFVQPLKMCGSFPFVEISGLWMANTGSYVYSDFAIGAFTVPLIAFGICILPFRLHDLHRHKSITKIVLYILMITMAVFIAWFDYCVAGIILSYVCDILPILTLLSVFTIIDELQYVARFKEMSVKAVCLISAIGVVTIILGAFELLSFREISLYKCMPDILCELEDIICFWN